VNTSTARGGNLARMGMGQEPPVALNPYAPPGGDIEFVATPATPDAAATALYSPKQMGWAALLGGFVLGVLFMRANYRALGNRAAARRTLWLGLIATAGLYAALVLTHERLTRLALVLASVIFAGFAEFMQGRSFHKHIGAGGKRRSHWAVIGWMAVCNVALGLLVLLGALIADGGELHDLSGPAGLR
jgi:hypothetical protein